MKSPEQIQRARLLMMEAYENLALQDATRSLACATITAFSWVLGDVDEEAGEVFAETLDRLEIAIAMNRAERSQVN